MCVWHESYVFGTHLNISLSPFLSSTHALISLLSCTLSCSLLLLLTWSYRFLSHAHTHSLISSLARPLSFIHVYPLSLSFSHTRELWYTTSHVHMYTMGWLRWVGSLKIHVSFAKEPYKRDDILQKRHIILRSLLIVAIFHLVWWYHVQTCIYNVQVRSILSSANILTMYVSLQCTHNVYMHVITVCT